ncbi:hypothetical protein MIT9_P1296 [Methylomarinovum caldicuralii]|uniref:RCK C-terminal domain-containing protein n=1 Tax=Methylomarinovum caldicuralii TaxID=438856 RepID=A0AAU9C2A1_9GAMM|nr:SLC13 family permease [Methylomarinovum caldicuralii]BCX81718.1 hypothetical protein MIT9_P1296 [Methylomarinovum caldicuralii]
MPLSAWLALAVTGLCILLLAWGRWAPELVLSGGLTLLLLAGVIDVPTALAGLSQPSVATVALMYVLVAGIRETGGVETIVRHLLGRPRHPAGTLLRVVLPVWLLSAFLNNTPVVTTFIPAVLTWARRFKLPVARLLLPLSYAAMLGGTCTLIGTSTNLVVNGLLARRHPELALGLFDLAWIGVPVGLAGIAYLVVAARWLLPDRNGARLFADPKEYTIEMEVDPAGPLVGKTIEAAGLRHLGDVYLVEIERDGALLAAVGPGERLRGGDRLVFAGSTHAALDLQQIKGLRPSTHSRFGLAEHPDRCIVEVVVSPDCALMGQTIRDGRFRTLYGAAVLAVCREGKRVEGNLGRIRLQPADTLLLETRPSFVEQYRHARDFLLVSEVDGPARPLHEKAWLAWSILAAVVALAASGALDLFKAALAGAAAMLVTGCCTFAKARRNVDTSVLLTIAAAFGLGSALETSGAGRFLAAGLLRLSDDPYVLLALTYGLVTLLTSLISNNAAAVLVFPILMAAVEHFQLNPLPYLVVLMLAASSSFATPIGYQTNLMVYGPGGYRFRDYLRCGGGLTLVVGLVGLWLVPKLWPLR